MAGLLVDLFGLLPSEARLAAALAGGDSLAEAAVHLGLTIETARTYSKKVFAKTGTRGQTDLVHRILANGLVGPDDLAPPDRLDDLQQDSPDDRPGAGQSAQRIAAPGLDRADREA